MNSGIKNENLYLAIKREGLTLRDFAELMEVSLKTVENWVFNDTRVFVGNVKKACTILNKTPYQLFGLDWDEKELERRIKISSQKIDYYNRKKQEQEEGIKIVVEEETPIVQKEVKLEVKVEPKQTETIQETLKQDEECTQTLKQLLNSIVGFSASFNIMNEEWDLISATTVYNIQQIREYQDTVQIQGIGSFITIAKNCLDKYVVSYEDILVRMYHFICEC